MKPSDNRLVVYASGHRLPDVYSRNYISVFFTDHEARLWLEHFLARHEYDREGNTIKLRTDFDIKLRSDQLDKILSAPVANQELRSDYKLHILRFKYGTWDENHREQASPSLDESPIVHHGVKPERERRPDIPPSFITISALCTGSNVLPTHARAALRASGRIKPTYGWAFDPQEINAIKSLIGIG